MSDDGGEPDGKSGGSTLDMSNLDWDAIRSGADSLPFQNQEGEAPVRAAAPAHAEAPGVPPNRLGSTIAGWPTTRPAPEPPPPSPAFPGNPTSDDGLHASSQLAPTLPQPLPHPAATRSPATRQRQQTLPSTSSSPLVRPAPAPDRTLSSLELTPAVAFTPPPMPPRSEVPDSPWAGAVARPKSAHPPPLRSPAAATPAPFVTPPAAPKPVAPPRAAPARSAVGFAWVWAQAGSSLRIRRHAAFKPLIDALEDRPVDVELDGAARDDGLSVEDRREVFEVLARGQSSAGATLRQTLRSAVRDDGKFVAPLALVDAELSTPFDERAELEAAITTVLPFVPAPEGDGRSPLGDVVAAATRFLTEAPELCPGATLTGFTGRIRHAFAEEERELPGDYLETTVERLLLQQRKYQARLVFGGSQLRTLLHVSDCSEPVPTYLPDDLANELPLFARFRVRVLAELHHREDQDEASPLALRGLALVRVLSLER